MKNDRAVCGLTLSLVAVAFIAPAFAQDADDFPSRRITLTVPYAAGSTNDIFGRIMAEGLSVQLDQPVVVLNQPGAGGTLGIGNVTRSPADGYSIAVVSTSSIAINRALYGGLPYDPASDLTPIGIPSSTPNALIVSRDEDINTVEELVSRANSLDAVLYNSPGNGTSQHLSGVLLSRLAELDAEHIPYHGQDGITDMLAGQTLYGFATVPSIVGMVRGGMVTMLATTGEQPSTAFPDVPTLASAGYTDFAYGEIWYGIATPTSTPDDIREKLSEALVRAVEDPTVQEQLTTAGFDALPAMSADEQRAFIDRQVEFWGDLVRDSGARAD